MSLGFGRLRFEEARAEAERLRAEKVKRWDEEDEKERKERERRREDDRLARVQAAEVDLKSRLREQFLRTPGSTPVGFDKVWPRLLEEHQVRETLAASDAATMLRDELRVATRGAAQFFERPAAAVPIAVESDD